MENSTINFIRDLFDPIHSDKYIPLHEPSISEKELEYVNLCIKSTFISSVGEYIGRFENMLTQFTGIPYAVAVSNGTSALHLSLVAAGVAHNDLVLTQALTFIGGVNPIKYCGADPIFIDSATDNLGMCPDKLQEFLEIHTAFDDAGCRIHKKTNRKIKACIPMHVFGHPVHIDRLKDICAKYHITLIEDAAEALGSFIGNQHVGHHGHMAILSFNGNKIVTSGGGGAILTSDENLAKKLKHLSTTAKKSHPWSFVHDDIGYNYRLPNLNAAFACAQMERIDEFLKNKRETAVLYRNFFKDKDILFIDEPKNCKSNFWINAIQLKNRDERETFLKMTNERKIGTRPIWTLIPNLSMYTNCIKTNLDNAVKYEERVVNLPSSVRIKNV